MRMHIRPRRKASARLRGEMPRAWSICSRPAALMPVASASSQTRDASSARKPGPPASASSTLATTMPTNAQPSRAEIAFRLRKPATAGSRLAKAMPAGIAGARSNVGSVLIGSRSLTVKARALDRASLALPRASSGDCGGALSASRICRQIGSLACSAALQRRDWQTASAMVPRPAQVSSTPRGCVVAGAGCHRCHDRPGTLRFLGAPACLRVLLGARRGGSLVALVGERFRLRVALGLVARRLVAARLSPAAIRLASALAALRPAPGRSDSAGVPPLPAG